MKPKGGFPHPPRQIFLQRAYLITILHVSPGIEYLLNYLNIGAGYGPVQSSISILIGGNDSSQ